MSGRKNTVTKNNRVNGLQVQSSLYGKPIPWGWGRRRVAINLIDYTDFKAIEQSSTSNTGSKGGSSRNTTISYTYYATVIMGICLGAPAIQGVRTVYRANSVFEDGAQTALSQAGLTLYSGSFGQPVWPFMTSNHPDKALGYSGIAYVCASGYQLDDSGGLENHTLEVDFAIQETAVSTGDANPADIINDFFTNPYNKLPSWPSGMLGDLSNLRLYCRAQNLLISPLLDDQVAASEFLTEVLACANSTVAWYDGQLKFITYGDTTVTGNGYTFIPNLTPVYDLGDDDYIPEADGDDPIKLDISDPSDAYNILQVKYSDRSHQYNTVTVNATDSGNISLYGERQDQSAKDLSYICDSEVAVVVANLMLKRILYVRGTYHFTLPWSFSRLDNGDIISLTDSYLYNRVPARITSWEEDESNDCLKFTAEPLMTGIAQSPLYPTQGVGGYQSNYNVDPGNISTPLLFNPPDTLVTTDGYELWAAVAGLSPNWGGAQVYVSLDGTNYELVGVINGSARYGVSTASFASGTDPDTTHTLSLDLSISAGTLASASQAEADAASSLCWLGGELISYTNSVLTSANHYDLNTYIRRGQNRTSIVTHATGTSFARLDSTIFKYPYLPQQVGKTIYVKFASFNIFGRAVQDLSDVTAYPVTLTKAQTVPDKVTGLALQSTFNTLQFNVGWKASAGATQYTVKVYKDDGTTLLRSSVAFSCAYSYRQLDAYNDSYLRRTFVVSVTAQNSAGDSDVTTLTGITNAAPATITGVGQTGSGTTRVISWSANAEIDKAGYVGYYSTVNGFNPNTGGGTQFYHGIDTSGTLSNLTVGTTYYVRVAAFDSWSDNPQDLNFSAQLTFVA